MFAAVTGAELIAASNAAWVALSTLIMSHDPSGVSPITLVSQ